jgi:hypothetical protein
MNERIKELITQARGHWNNGDFNMPSSVEFQAEDIEKFAELIVLECISIAQDRAAFDWAAPNDVNHIISEIKEHFGVGDIPEPSKQS